MIGYTEVSKRELRETPRFLAGETESLVVPHRGDVLMILHLSHQSSSSPFTALLCAQEVVIYGLNHLGSFDLWFQVGFGHWWYQQEIVVTGHSLVMSVATGSVRQPFLHM